MWLTVKSVGKNSISSMIYAQKCDCIYLWRTTENISWDDTFVAQESLKLPHKTLRLSRSKDTRLEARQGICTVFFSSY